MALLPYNRDRADQLGGRGLRPAPGQVLGFGEDIPTKSTTRDGLHNDVNSIIAELLGAADPFENLTAFPDVDDYDDDAIILVNGSWYFKHDGAGIAANTFTGQHDDHYQTTDDGSQDVYSGSANNGAWPEFQGTTGFRHNPGGALSYLLAINGTGFRLGIRKSVYEAAKGSAVAAGDQVTLVISYATSPAQSETVTFTYVKEYDNHYSDTGHVPYLDFAAPVLDGSTYRMSGTPIGTHWSAIVYAGATANTVLLTHDEDLVHWQAFTDNVTRWLRDRVNENISKIGTVNSALARVKRLTGDILGGEHVVPSWGEVNASGAEGGLYFSQNPALAEARTASYSAPSLQAPRGGGFFVARIPVGNDPRRYIMREPSAHFGDIDTPLTDISHIGSDDNWDYYENDVRLFGNISLRSSSHTVGQNTWGGKLGDSALKQVNGQLADTEDLARLKRATRDILVTTKTGSGGFRNANNNGSEGGIAFGATWDLTRAQGATYTAPTVAAASATGAALVRIPIAHDARAYQVVIVGLGSDVLSHLAIRVFSDSNYQYWEAANFQGEFAVTLRYNPQEVTTTTEWDGTLGENAVKSASKQRSVLLWEHTAQASDWHNSSGPQLGSGVSTAVYSGIGGDDPWVRLEAEVKWTQTIQGVAHEHVGLITFPGWRSGTILPARPVNLHGQGRIGGQQNTSTMNAVLKLVSRNDERTSASHLFIEGFNTPGDTGIGGSTQITVKLYGVR